MFLIGDLGLLLAPATLTWLWVVMAGLGPLLFPLVLCTLPAFGLLTVAPLVAGTFDSLRGGHLEAPASLGP